MSEKVKNLYIAHVDMTAGFLDPAFATGCPSGAQERINKFMGQLRAQLGDYMGASEENKRGVEEQNPIIPPYIAVVKGDQFFGDAMVTVDQFSVSASLIEGDNVLCRLGGEEQRLPINEGLAALLSRPQFPNDKMMNLVVEFGEADYLKDLEELTGYKVCKLS